MGQTARGAPEIGGSAHRFRVAVKNEPTLFPRHQPPWVQEATSSQMQSSPASHLDELLGEPPNFPTDFLPDGSAIGQALTLPTDTLELKIDRDGQWVLSTLSGFHLAVKNEVEGKYILYAKLRGHAVVDLPTAMIHIFKAVAAFEKHCRDQFQRIVQALELKSTNRQLAEYQTRQLFKSRNLPLV